MRRPRVIVLLLAVSCFLVSCSSTKIKTYSEENVMTDKEIILSDRQFSILESMQLPLDYSQLNDNQKNSIVSIENMLEYIENKYPYEFDFLAYYPQSFDSSEHLLVSVNDDINTKVNVYKSYADGEIVYSDDFEKVFFEKEYKNAIAEIINKYIAQELYSLVSEISNVADNDEAVLSKCAGNSYVFIDNELYSATFQDDTAYEICREIAEQSHGNPQEVKFYFVKDKCFAAYEKNNFRHMLSSSYIESTVFCSINSDGKITIY